MKNLFKIGFLAIALSLSLTSCDFFGKKHETSEKVSDKIDSQAIDSAKIDSTTLDSTKKTTDSVPLNH